MFVYILHNFLHHVTAGGHSHRHHIYLHVSSFPAAQCNAYYYSLPSKIIELRFP